jgi:hypothetical protein
MSCILTPLTFSMYYRWYFVSSAISILETRQFFLRISFRSSKEQFYMRITLVPFKAIPVKGCGGPYGCETSRLPHFLDNRLTQIAVRSSGLGDNCLLPPGRFLELISVRDWVDPRITVWLEGFFYYFFLIRLVGGGVQLGPLGTAATDWPIVACPGWLWWWRILWNENWQGKPKYSETGRIRSIEKSSDFIGNRTYDLPACCIVSQPTTLPRAL